ncbi:hypothetical protein QJQ45_007939 [Haematococcus lacustris]|nr:hypothetical protein QJQ45_007939 [Haematococcus lacustris]
MAPLAQLVTAIPAAHANLADVHCSSPVVADWSSAATRPLVLEEPASLALFCTGLAPDLGPAPEVMPACCAAFTGVAPKHNQDTLRTLSTSNNTQQQQRPTQQQQPTQLPVLSLLHDRCSVAPPLSPFCQVVASGAAHEHESSREPIAGRS